MASLRRTRPLASNPGVDLARLLLRGVVGGTMVAHGLKHGRSLEGTAGWFGSIGFRAPKAQATASAVTEVAAGSALLAGAATPLAAAAVVGTLGVAAGSVHVQNGFFITSEGYEYVLTLSTAAAVLAALGAGRWSVDHAVGRLDSGPSAAAGLFALGVGAGGAVGHLAAFWRRPA
jgi:putative oxidoreductase